jgi:hypothetical protein
MNEMLERCAGVLGNAPNIAGYTLRGMLWKVAEACGLKWDEASFQDDCENIVRAILNELKQVDEGMVEAGEKAFLAWEGARPASTEGFERPMFCAMIDFVLSEGE